eukprot:superscaffoldBa00000131_g1909
MVQILLLLLPALSPALAWMPVEDWESGSVTASMGESGQCVCHVYLPDTTFPADRVEHMQQVSKDLILEVEIQMNKMVSYEAKLDVYLEELKKLTFRVAMLESSPDSYIKLDFELLRIELREFEVLVSQLKDSLNSSSPMFDSLYTEIRNMTLIVNQLETYDKSNLEVIRIEFAKLQKKLEECQKEQEFIKPDIGNCNHTGIMSISKPMVVQLNAHLNAGFQYGGWGKDSKPVRGYESMYFYGAYSSPSVHDFYLYSNYENLIQRSAFKQHDIPGGWRGTGNNYIVHGNTIYYQINTPFSMTKLNLTSSKYDYRVIPAASQKFSYSYSDNQNLDFAADETGLWVIYASEESKGKIVLAKIDEKSFGIEDEWNTGAYKQLAGNAFMACGVMYLTRSVDVNTEEIYYAFNTKTREEKHLSIHFHKFQDKYSNLDYNPTDQKLYMYNNGYYVSYNLVHYGGKLDIFLGQLKDLTFRVVMLESSPDNYIKLDFELLRIELREFEVLVSQLKDSLNSSKSEIDSQCQHFYFLPVNCNRTGIMSISKPNAHLNPAYPYGGREKTPNLHEALNYCTEEAMGKIAIAKIDEKSFGTEDEWTTSAFKPLVGNVFMVCGVMYATRPADVNTEEIHYSYNTKTWEEKHLSIPLQKFQENFVNLHYNPTDQRLYMYNNGYYVSYNVRFNKE